MGWVVVVCKVIFVSNPTYIKLFWVVGCVVVLTITQELLEKKHPVEGDWLAVLAKDGAVLTSSA